MPELNTTMSDTGEHLSPKYAPQTIAPAVRGTGRPMPIEIPMKATPIVPIVVQEEPVMLERTEHMMTMKGKYHDGFRRPRPR